LHARELQAAIDEVNVIVDEARNGEAAAQIDDARVRWNRAVDGGDAIAFDDQRRREPLTGPDPAACQRERVYSPSLICWAR
jgi:hypothetical protein